MTRSHPTPAISIGLAVRNDPDRVRRCIESVLAQDWTDLELVICDNASDDATPDALMEFASADRRVKVHLNPVNIGSQENMNRVLEFSSGTLFRWISSDDWLEPRALSTAVQALERNPSAIGVTSGFTLHMAGIGARREDYRGEFPDSADPARRFERMLWFFQAGATKYDPIYGVYRREALMRTERLRPSERADYLLCAELALNGPIMHVHEDLAHRCWSVPTAVERAAFRRRLDPVHGETLKSTPNRLYREFNALVRSMDLTDVQRRRCARAVRRFWVLECVRIGRLRASDRVHLTVAALQRPRSVNGHAAAPQRAPAASGRR
jgi:glycosyltransferase involved in cell wall biosynthesis